MKRTLLSVLFATCAIFGSAQKIGEPIQVPNHHNRNIYLTPSCFTKNGETLVVLPVINDTEEESKALNIYDNDFPTAIVLINLKSLS